MKSESHSAAVRGGRWEGRWKGVYPGHCINPETCRGYGHCPREHSCVE